MKIVLFGDSITDMGRDRINNQPNYLGSYGCGYPIFIAGELYKQDPTKHVIYNRGISGNRIVDLYARIKMDVWNLKPDVLSILIGINDIWHEIGDKNGVDIVRFERASSYWRSASTSAVVIITSTGSISICAVGSAFFIPALSCSKRIRSCAACWSIRSIFSSCSTIT